MGKYHYLDSEKKWIELAKEDRITRLSALKAKFSLYKAQALADAKKSTKAEQYVQRMTGGLVKQFDKRAKSVATIHGELQQGGYELEAFRCLLQQEGAAIISRTQILKDMVHSEKERNGNLQAKHRQLGVVKEELRAALQ